MSSVSIKELKSHLDRYIAAVKSGEVVVVTEGGQPVARIVKEPAADAGDREALEKLAARGLVQLPTRKRNKATLPRLNLRGEPLSKAIIEDRG